MPGTVRAVGCAEALFTLGEGPERRYAEARAWLSRNGYISTIDCLVAIGERVLNETGLLPHANAGAISRRRVGPAAHGGAEPGDDDRVVAADLAAHRGAPDKTPERRLATLQAAGALNIPFTTGILVGIGETEADRIEALLAIARAHRRHGHVQEVIVQNFLPKPGTAMRDAPPCSPEEHVRAIALARLIVPFDVHLQAPPNLTDTGQLGDLLAAGIDDWGGVSPVTADHVNPERPWPALRTLRAVTEDAGHTLAPRLTIYPEFALDPDRWLDERTRFPVLDRADCEGLARDDPGAVWPEGRRGRQRGHRRRGDPDRSTVHRLVLGCGRDPPVLIPAPAFARGQVREVLDGARAGQELGAAEIVALFGARGPEVAAVAELADELRRELVGDEVTYVVNRNINYTNVCTFRCTFCGFSKGPLSLNLRGKPYLLSLDDIAERSREAVDRGATEVCLQGGIHPHFDGNFYVEVARAVHDSRAGPAHPRVHRAGGARRGETPRRAADRLPTPIAGGGPEDLARHGGGDPGRRDPAGHLPRQDHDRGMARGAPGRAFARAAQQRDDHVRVGRAA